MEEQDDVSDIFDDEREECPELELEEEMSFERFSDAFEEVDFLAGAEKDSLLEMLICMSTLGCALASQLLQNWQNASQSLLLLLLVSMHFGERGDDVDFVVFFPHLFCSTLMMKKLFVLEVMLFCVGATDNDGATDKDGPTDKDGTVGLAVSTTAAPPTGDSHGCCSIVGDDQDVGRSIAGEVSILRGSLMEGKFKPLIAEEGSRGVEVWGPKLRSAAVLRTSGEEKLELPRGLEEPLCLGGMSATGLPLEIMALGRLISC